MNLVPAQYRSVSVADVPGPLDEPALRAHLVGRPAYRRTRYLIVRSGGQTALAEVGKVSEQPLFSPITSLDLLAGPGETAFVTAPDTDTAVPTQLARAAAAGAPGARCVVVSGRYGHISFILGPAPVRLRVVEVVPPAPAKLVDQLTRVLDVAEDLPPVELVPDLADLSSLAATRPGGHYLFPCRAGGAELPAGVSYLDEIPPRAPWTLVGCARSRAIHDWFYGDDVAVVDICPRNLAAAPGRGLAAGEEPVLAKCCLLEDRVVTDGRLVVVPWGATLSQLRHGLELAVRAARAIPAAPRAAAGGQAGP
ncbi:MAG: hypothetical protein LBI49_24820 [Nocardiopsaceae bacterium]|jgi:hypothetical protein|nr:hypothetical protein [Nocardiopsaceae bacterium]